MNILIIGGARFIGPRIVRHLLQKEHVLTIFNTGNHPMPPSEHMTVVRGDRNAGFRRIQGSFDVIIDTCAYKRHHMQLALSELSFNKYILVSTAAVYQKSSEMPLREDSSPLGPCPLWGAYNEGKRECEQALSESGQKFAIIRPVYILGQGNHIDREKYIYSKIANGEPLIIPGDGNALVQFVFVQDIATAMSLLAETDAEGAYNCCGDDIMTLNDLVRTMSIIVGKKANISHNTHANGKHFDVKEFPFANEQCFCSNDKLRALGMRFTPLMEGLRRDYQEYYQYAISR